jgi:hypothetical protein
MGRESGPHATPTGEPGVRVDPEGVAIVPLLILSWLLALAAFGLWMVHFVVYFGLYQFVRNMRKQMDQALSQLNLQQRAGMLPSGRPFATLAWVSLACAAISVAAPLIRWPVIVAIVINAVSVVLAIVLAVLAKRGLLSGQWLNRVAQSGMDFMQAGNQPPLKDVPNKSDENEERQ